VSTSSALAATNAAPASCAIRAKLTLRMRPTEIGRSTVSGL
jgi:hypothetical protein